jgi:hypothetical protein
MADTTNSNRAGELLAQLATKERELGQLRFELTKIEKKGRLDLTQIDQQLNYLFHARIQAEASGQNAKHITQAHSNATTHKVSTQARNSRTLR